MSTDKLVELITKAIAFKYPKDATRPGLTISLLNNKYYYVSVVRHNIDGKVKVVAHKSQNLSLENSLKQVAQQLVADVEPKNPLEVLSQSILPAKVAPKLSTDMCCNQDDEDDIFPQYEPTWPRKG